MLTKDEARRVAVNIAGRQSWVNGPNGQNEWPHLSPPRTACCRSSGPIPSSPRPIALITMPNL
jgi:hypothetical protein